MHHFAPQKAAANLAAHPHLSAHAKRFLVRRVKIQEAQHAGIAAIIDRDQQLAPRPDRNFAVHHLAFELHHLAVTRIGQAHDAGFVLVAQGQVQGQVDVAPESQLVEGFLRRRFSLRFGGRLARRTGRGRGGFQGLVRGRSSRLHHGTIVPS